MLWIIFVAVGIWCTSNLGFTVFLNRVSGLIGVC